MLDPLDPLRVCAVAIRLINLAWFRVGSDRHTKRSRTYGVTTLNKSHVKVRGTRVTFRFRAKGKVQVRTAVVDVELADSDPRAARDAGPPPLPLRGRRRALQPHRPPPERVHPRVHGRRLLRQGLPHLGRDADRGDRVRRARSRRGKDRAETRRRGGDAEASPNGSAIRPQLRELHTSRRPSSSSTSTGERSRISVHAICASSPRVISVSIRRNRRRSRCFARGGYARVEKPPRIPLAIPPGKERSWPGRPCSSATVAARKWTKAKAPSCA